MLVAKRCQEGCSVAVVERSRGRVSRRGVVIDGMAVTSS
jgi:hypothetical protein